MRPPPRLATCLAVLAGAPALAAGCGGGDTGAREPARGSAAAPAGAATTPTPSTAPPLAALPAPDGALPKSPARLGPGLEAVRSRLRAAVVAWLQDRGARGATPRSVQLLALRHQRIHRRLARRPGYAARVLAHTGRGTRREARLLLGAMRALARLNAPHAQVPRRFRTQDPPAPAVLRRYYHAAHERFGVGWRLLAAVHFVESGFGRMRNESVAGAQGPMQFMPATWAAYGLGGDVHDPRDAILGAANYLAAAGAPQDEAGALYRYNPSPLYVRAVSRYAELMRRDELTFHVLHSWQVFVRTPNGTRRLTGPR